jgi:hypothetical protein
MRDSVYLPGANFPFIIRNGFLLLGTPETQFSTCMKAASSYWHPGKAVIFIIRNTWRLALFVLLLRYIKLVAKRHYIIMSYSKDDNPDLMKKALTLGPTINNV